jgi:hypothetical protein
MNSPNGDPQMDFLINHLAHELIEVMIAPIPRQTYQDQNLNEVMDK